MTNLTHHPAFTDFRVQLAPVPTICSGLLWASEELVAAAEVGRRSLRQGGEEPSMHPTLTIGTRVNLEISLLHVHPLAEDIALVDAQGRHAISIGDVQCHVSCRVGTSVYDSLESTPGP